MIPWACSPSSPIGSNVRRIARVYGREQASRAYITGESMEEDDMVMRVGNSLRQERETNRWGRKGCKPKGSYKEVPRPSRGLALAAAKRSLTLIHNCNEVIPL